MNIQKPEAGWWRGDYGGLRSHWFPANFTRLEESQLGLEENNDSLECSGDNLKRGQPRQLWLLFKVKLDINVERRRLYCCVQH